MDFSCFQKFRVGLNSGLNHFQRIECTHNSDKGQSTGNALHLCIFQLISYVIHYRNQIIFQKLSAASIILQRGYFQSSEFKCEINKFFFNNNVILIIYNKYMYSNQEQKENNKEIEQKEFTQQTKGQKIEKYIPIRSHTSEGKFAEKPFKFISTKTLGDSNRNRVLCDRKQALREEENIFNHDREFEKNQLPSELFTEEEIFQSKLYKDLEKQFDKENKTHIKEMLRLDHILQQKNIQTEAISTKNSQLKDQLTDLKYQFFALKVIEREEDEENYRLLKEMEEFLITQKLKEQLKADLQAQKQEIVEVEPPPLPQQKQFSDPQQNQ